MESTSSAPGKITVTGPESVVSQIKTAQAVVDISNAEENVATSSPIVLLDADGNEIPQDRLSLNRTSVDVDVEISMGKIGSTEIYYEWNTGRRLSFRGGKMQ